MAFSKRRQSFPATARRTLVWLVVVACCVAASTGCVRRRLTVRSNPPGALVYVDNQQIGTTPCSVDFVYYGTREIRLIKPGYETLTVNQPIPTPWYEFPPLDFVSENLAPQKIRDNRTVTYNLAPQVIVPTQELVDRGNQLRQATFQGTAVPGMSVPLGTPPEVVGPPIALPPTDSVILPPQSLPPTTAPLVLPPAEALPLPPPERGRRIVSPPLN